MWQTALPALWLKLPSAAAAKRTPWQGTTQQLSRCLSCLRRTAMQHDMGFGPE